MADASVFKANILIGDQTHAAMQKIAENLRAVGKVTHALGEHARGVATVMKAAFGEAEHGARHAAEAIHKTAAELHATKVAAQEADHALDHAARPRGWETAAAHISLFRSRFGNLSLGAGEFGRGMSALLPVLGGLGVAGSLEGVFELVEKTSEGFSQMSNAAQSIGVSVQQFQQLSLAAKMADLSVDTLRTGMFRLGYGMQDAISGRNKDLAGLFAHLHIDPHKPVMQVMAQLADAFKNTKSESMRQKMAQALFGRGGAGMIPLLSGGAEGLREAFKLSDQVDFTPTKEQAESLERYHRSMIGLTAAVEGLKNAVGTSLADALRPGVDLMRDWIASNRDWIAQDIATKIKYAGDALKAVDWQGVGAVLRKLGDDFAWLTDHVGGAKVMLEALIAVKVVSWTAEWANKFLALGLAVRAVIASIQALDVAVSSSTVGAAIAKLIPAGARMAGGVGAGLYTFFNPTPTIGDEAERAQLDAALKAMGLPPAVHQSARALSNAIAPPGVLPERPTNPRAPPYYSPMEHLLQRQSAPPLPRLFHPGGAAAPTAPPAQATPGGTVHSIVTFRNAPPGTQVQTETRGNVASDVDVGYALSGLEGY